MGCPIEWAHDADFFWYSDRLVNSTVSGSNWIDRQRSVGKVSHHPFQILSFAQLRKNWSPAPPMIRLRVIGRRGPIFSTVRAFKQVSFRPLKMRSLLGLLRKRVSALQTLFFSLFHVPFALIKICSIPSFIFFRVYCPFSE